MDRKKVRLYYWLVTAYLAKHSRFIVSSFLFSLVLLAAYVYFSSEIIGYLTTKQRTIGLAGTYTLSKLPPEILAKTTTPFLYKNANGEYESKILESWTRDKTYTKFEFVLLPDLTFTDGTPFTSKDIRLEFKDVRVDTSNPSKIIYTLSKPFPSFLDYLNKPIISKNPLKGIAGDYIITRYKLASTQDRLSSVVLSPLSETNPLLTYRIYKSESDLITAFKLQEIDEFTTSNKAAYENLKTWPRTVARIDNIYTQVLTLFYNTSHPLLKEKDVREAIYGSIPLDVLKEHGSIAVSPLSPLSPYYDKTIIRIPENPEVNKSILKKFFGSASNEAKFKLYASLDHLDVANTIRDVVTGSDGDVELDVTGLQKGDRYDLLLGVWNIPTESNQYFVWHSSQKGKGNITEYENPKIDKLLENFRATSEAKLQQKNMSDFQKQIVRDVPAAFLYYPYIYTISRER